MSDIKIEELDVERMRKLYYAGYKNIGKTDKPTERSDEWLREMVRGMTFRDDSVTLETIEKFVFHNADKISNNGRAAKQYGFGAMARFKPDLVTMPTDEEIENILNPPAEPASEPAEPSEPKDGVPGMPNIPKSGYSGEYADKSPQEMALILAKQMAKDRRELMIEKMKIEAEQREQMMKKEMEKFEKKMKKIRESQGTVDVIEGEFHCNGWRRIYTHKQAALLMLNGETVALWGPKGTGKTEYWINLSADLGWRPPYITTAPMFKTDLTGFIDAMGKYNSTPFTEGFQADADHPCIVMIEEADRATPEALIALNSALANGVMDTPIGNIRRGEGCHIVFTANTNGEGGSLEYVTANQLDASTVDRAKWLYCGYDPKVIENLCGENKELEAFANDVLQALKVISHIRGISMTYRIIRDIKNSEVIFEMNNIKNATVKALDCSMTKGANAASIRSVFDALKDKENKYAQAFSKIPEVMGKLGGY